MEHPPIFKCFGDAGHRGKHRLPKGITSLPPDILRGASKRLAISGLVMAGMCFLWALFYAFLPLIDPTETGQAFDLVHLTTIGMLVVSIAVYFLAKSELMAPQRMLDFGLFYLIVIAFVAGVALRLMPGPLHIPSDWGISEICILILLFPVIIPNTPVKTVVAALVAASMDPLGIYLAVQHGKVIPEGASVFAAVFPNYICAGLALVPSFIMHHLVRQVSHARQMGSYNLTELLGRGGMGEVWRADHQLLSREAAIKLVRPEVLVGQNADSRQVLLKRFEREAQATSLMCSPHTIDIYDFGLSDDGTFYYVMELLDGFDLDGFVRKFGPMPPARAVPLLRQVCDSLAEAHEAELIHRDIKPANVYVCRYGRAVDFIKVLDFGIVKPQTTRGGGDAQLTGEHVPGGTPAFMAPEQVLGEPPVDARTDLYAVGCLGYWLLTGQPVFSGETSMKIMMAHVQDDPPPPSARSELSIPPALDDVLLACLQKDPDRRPQDADTLSAALGTSVQEKPWTAEQSREWWDVHVPRSAARVRL
ncbi:serine/threonine-protein kinase [Candidatus Eisenbacteria bacterium]|uniref:Serine/threonine-protein kinase n=1 Tax=Eiseniibacteriota bacterium TaxID=2212470 RepID=A0ABV6YJ37_UNCEI